MEKNQVKQTVVVNMIEYELPKVKEMNVTGIGISEIAARTCYGSFDKSENGEIKQYDFGQTSKGFNDIEHSKLLNELAWVHHHHSILEHSVISYHVKGISRGVLQEHARHRIQGISVMSSRYTMSSILNAFITAKVISDVSVPTAKGIFYTLLETLDMFVTVDPEYNKIETGAMYDKLMFQFIKLGSDGFNKLALSKDGIELYNTGKPKVSIKTVMEFFDKLETARGKRNVGDNFKHIVTDNWKTEMIITFNLRSLKNYFELRDSGAAWFQIRWLAEAMIKVTPKKYLKLIHKGYRE